MEDNTHTFSVSKTKKVTFCLGNLALVNDDLTENCYYDLLVDDNRDILFDCTSEGAICHPRQNEAIAELSEGKLLDANEARFLLTPEEVNFLLCKRSTSAIGKNHNARYLKATVRNKPGILIFPDEFSYPDNVPVPSVLVLNNPNARFERVTFKYIDWLRLSQAGAIFLPAMKFEGGFNPYKYDHEFFVDENAEKAHAFRCVDEQL